MKNVNNVVSDYFVGKTLKSFGFGQNEEGCQTVTLNQKIIKAQIGVNDGDGVVWLTLENGEEAYAYDNEGIEVEKEV